MKGALGIVLCISLVICSSKTVAQDGCEKPKEIDFANLELNTKLLIGSRWAIEQEQKNEKIDVYHAIEVVDISKVDVETMSIRVEVHIHQRWQANALKLPVGLFEEGDSPDTFIRADQDILNSMWSPDSYIPNARETKIASMTTTQSVVNIFQNKTIKFKARLHTVLGCSFTFQWYPLDKQTCDLTIESYTWSSDMVNYLWEDQQTPVIITNLKLLQYEMNQPLEYGNGTAQRWHRSSTYPYVLLRFAFERQLAHHLIQIFTPTILVVILSWFSFWLGMDAIPGRVSLLITCMLTLVTMHSSMKGAIPPVNYIKAMDIWMVSCMAFVFAALCEFIVVKYLHWRLQQKLKNTEDQEKAMAKYRTINAKVLERGGSDLPVQKTFNPYMEFYRNMNEGSDGPYPLGLMQQQQKRLDKPKPAWQDFSSPTGEYFQPMQYQMLQGQYGYPEGQWPFVKKKRPFWQVIDRVARVAFPVAFVIFNGAYWPILLIGAANQ